jgi:hypothetical protein
VPSSRGASLGAGEKPAEQRRRRESDASIAMRERDERVDVQEDNVSVSSVDRRVRNWRGG